MNVSIFHSFFSFICAYYMMQQCLRHIEMMHPVAFIFKGQITVHTTELIGSNMSMEKLLISSELC